MLYTKEFFPRERERKKWGCECDLALRAVRRMQLSGRGKGEVHFCPFCPTTCSHHHLTCASPTSFPFIHTLIHYHHPHCHFLFFSFLFHQNTEILERDSQSLRSLHHTLLGYLSIMAYHFHRCPHTSTISIVGNFVHIQ